MPTSPQRIIWDSCVIIDAIQKTPSRYPSIAPFLEDAENGKLQIVISEISVAEVRHLKNLDEQGIPITKQVALIRDWLENPFIVRRTVHPGVSELAGALGREHGLKRVGDATILATAVFDGIPLLHTYDGEGGKPGLIKLDGKIGNPPIRITEPTHEQMRLFDPL